MTANTCTLPGCDNPTPKNGHGRPSEFCSDAHRVEAFRFARRYLKRAGVLALLTEVRQAVISWKLLQLTYDYEQWRIFVAAMNAIATHPIVVGTRANPSQPAVPSPYPLPGDRIGCAPPSAEGHAGQGGEE